MKTERQWQKVWDLHYSKKKSHHPQTRDFLAARKLLLEYTGYGSKYSVYEWPYFLTSLSRFFTGSWNRHHGIEIRNSLENHVYDPEKTVFLVSSENNYDHLPRENSNSDSTNTSYQKKLMSIGTAGYRVSRELDTKVENAIRNNEPLDNIITLDDGKSYQLKKVSVRYDENKNLKFWSAQVEAIVRREQSYDFINKIQQELSDTPIHRHGDLAKILRIIEANTNHRIAVKYYDFGIDHLLSMGKEFVETFKPYKVSTSDYYFKRDLKQPLSGFNNMVKGIFSIAGIPLIFMRNALSLLFFSRSHDGSWNSLGQDIYDNAKVTLVEPSLYLAEGLFSLAHGFLQLATTPLIPFKVGIRSLISWLNERNKNETIEARIKHSYRIQEMFHRLDETKNNDETHQLKTVLRSEIHRKYLKGIARGEKTSLQNENAFFMKFQYPQDTLDKPEIDNGVDAQKEYLDIFKM